MYPCLEECLGSSQKGLRNVVIGDKFGHQMKDLENRLHLRLQLLPGLLILASRGQCSLMLSEE